MINKGKCFGLLQCVKVILSTCSLRKCMENRLESLCLDNSSWYSSQVRSDQSCSATTCNPVQPAAWSGSQWLNGLPYQFLAGEEGGLTPCRVKNKTCQSAGELTVSQQPLSKSWQGVATHQGASVTLYGQWLGCGWLSSRSDTLVTIFLKYPFQCLSCCHGNLCPAWCSCLPSWQIAWATSSVVNCTAVQYIMTSQQSVQMWFQENAKRLSVQYCSHNMQRDSNVSVTNSFTRPVLPCTNLKVIFISPKKF